MIIPNMMCNVERTKVTTNRSEMNSVLKRLLQAYVYAQATNGKATIWKIRNNENTPHSFLIIIII